MKLGPVAAFAVTAVMAATGPTLAQGVPGEQQAAPPCFNDFVPLRNEAEKRAKAIQAAGKRKAPPKEICELFKRFYAAEDKAVKYASANQVWCGIPGQAVKSMEANHAKTRQIRNRVCTASVAPPPHKPSLSDALGTTTVPSAGTVHTGRGTFDSLTGNPLK